MKEDVQYRMILLFLKLKYYENLVKMQHLNSAPRYYHKVTKTRSIVIQLILYM